MTQLFSQLNNTQPGFIYACPWIDNTYAKRALWIWFPSSDVSSPVLVHLSKAPVQQLRSAKDDLYNLLIMATNIGITYGMHLTPRRYPRQEPPRAWIRLLTKICHRLSIMLTVCLCQHHIITLPELVMF